MIAIVFKFNSVKVIMAILNNTPIPAAKILGPAFTGLFLILNNDIICVEITAKGLSFANRAALKKKSIRRMTTGSKFAVTKYITRKTDVIKALKRAVFSFITLSEIGQTAFVFILFFLIDYYDTKIASA